MILKQTDTIFVIKQDMWDAVSNIIILIYGDEVVAKKETGCFSYNPDLINISKILDKKVYSRNIRFLFV